MGVLKTTLIDELFSQKKAHQYKLSILIGMDSFLYMVYDQNQYVLLLKEYHFNQQRSDTQPSGVSVLKFVEQDRLLKLPYADIKIAYLGIIQTFVPNRLYHPDQKRIYLDHIANISTSEIVRSDDLSLLRAQNIYTVEKAIFSLMQQLFVRARHYHLSSALYLGYRQCCDAEEKSVFLNIRDRQMQLFLFQEQKLIFYNQFAINSSDDLVYYSLLCYQQHRLSPQTQAIKVSGDFPEGESYHRALSKHIRYIYPVHTPIDYQYKDNHESTLGQHHFFDLLSIALCS